MAKILKVFRVDEGVVENPKGFKTLVWQQTGKANTFEPGLDIEKPSHTLAGVQANIEKARRALNFAVAEKQPEKLIKQYEDKVKYYEKIEASLKESSLLCSINQLLSVEESTGLSPTTLSSYKKKAGEYASAADKAAEIMAQAGDSAASKRWTDRANKKFSGILKATNKQFSNDAKGLK